MKQMQQGYGLTIVVLLALGALAVVSGGIIRATSAQETEAPSGTAAPDATAAKEDGACCKAGDTTPPTELVKQVPKGQLHSPYPDYAKLAQEDPDLVKQFRLPGCNECHGGTGGGGICPALTQGVWFWGNTDDVLFRLITLGSVDLEKEGYTRLGYGSVHAPMPPMGATIPTSDQLWKIIAFIRSINPPGTNPPDKILPKE
jgi:mono/diheme cytochrome c family protein